MTDEIYYQRIGSHYMYMQDILEDRIPGPFHLDIIDPFHGMVLKSTEIGVTPDLPEDFVDNEGVHWRKWIKQSNKQFLTDGISYTGIHTGTPKYFVKEGVSEVSGSHPALWSELKNKGLIDT